MSGVFPVKGPPKGFRGFGIERDLRLNNVRVTNQTQLGFVDSNNFPPSYWPGVGGGIAYDLTTRRPYYADGYDWFPFGAGAPGTVESYSFVKDGVQVVPRATNTIITPWEITSSDVYHNILGWDLASGIYTSFTDETITLEVNIAWAAGISNLGDRTLRIQHMKLGIPVWNTIKEVTTQADPDLRVQTTQECQIHAQIGQGDAVRVTVEHDAPTSVSLCGGNCTSISGFRVNIT